MEVAYAYKTQLKFIVCTDTKATQMFEWVGFSILLILQMQINIKITKVSNVNTHFENADFVSLWKQCISLLFHSVLYVKNTALCSVPHLKY